MLLIVSILLALCPAASQAQQSASARMVARLQQIASEVRTQVPANLNTLNMNAASAVYLREQVAKAQSRDREQALRLELAIQLLRAGQTREAIAELDILQAQDLPPLFELESATGWALPTCASASRKTACSTTPSPLVCCPSKARESTPCKKARRLLSNNTQRPCTQTRMT